MHYDQLIVLVIAPARIGRDKSNRSAVIETDQVNRVSRSGLRRGDRILILVLIKLIAPIIDDIPARWRLKIVKSTGLYVLDWIKLGDL